MPLPLHVSVQRRRGEPRELPRADLRTWDKLLELAGDDPAQREALSYLRGLLGANYRGLRTSTSLAMTLSTRIQHGPPECVRIYEMLRRLEDQHHLKTIVRNQLGRDGTEYLHGMTVIELAAAARARGESIQMYPPGGRGSQPDLDVGRMQLEITCSVERDDEERSSLYMDALIGFGEAGLKINDFDFDIYARESPSDAVATLIEAARFARFTPAPRQAGSIGFVSYAPAMKTSVPVAGRFRSGRPQAAGAAAGTSATW